MIGSDGQNPTGMAGYTPANAIEDGLLFAAIGENLRRLQIKS